MTRAAKRQANHALALSASRAGLTSVTPSSGDWSSLPPGLLVGDFQALAKDLSERPPALLRPRTLASQMRVLAIEPGNVLRIGYRPGDQELVAVLGDGQGGTVTVVRRHTRTGPSALDVLARALADTPGPRFIAGEVRLGPLGLELDPTAIVVTDRVPRPRSRHRATLRRAAAAARTRHELADAPRAPRGERAPRGSTARRSRASPPGLLERAAAATQTLRATGLEGAARRVAALADAVRTHDPSSARAWLDAAIRIELTREATLSHA